MGAGSIVSGRSDTFALRSPVKKEESDEKRDTVKSESVDPSDATAGTSRRVSSLPSRPPLKIETLEDQSGTNTETKTQEGASQTTVEGSAESIGIKQELAGHTQFSSREDSPAEMEVQIKEEPVDDISLHSIPLCRQQRLRQERHNAWMASGLHGLLQMRHEVGASSETDYSYTEQDLIKAIRTCEGRLFTQSVPPITLFDPRTKRTYSLVQSDDSDYDRDGAIRSSDRRYIGALSKTLDLVLLDLLLDATGTLKGLTRIGRMDLVEEVRERALKIEASAARQEAIARAMNAAL